jgi:hypothetical protein
MISGIHEGVPRESTTRQQHLAAAVSINSEGSAAPGGEASMTNASRRRLPIQQADRVLSPERKRELTIDVMASWALDGLELDPQAVERINAYLRGEVTMEEYLGKLKSA